MNAIFKNFRPATLSAIVSLAAMATLSGCVTRGAALGDAAQRAPSEFAQAEPAAKPEMNDRETHLRLIMQMQQKGLYFASLAHIDALEQRWGVSPDSRLLRADALRLTAQPDAAKALYTDLLTTPAKARAAHGLGLLAGRSGDLTAAVGYFRQANQLAPTSGAVLNDLGFVLLQQGRLAEARVPLMKASELDTDNPRVWSNVALYLTLSQQPDEARQVMDAQKFSPAVRAQIADLASQLRAARPLAEEPVASAALTPAQAFAAARRLAQPFTDAAPAEPKTTPVVVRDIGVDELATLPATAPAAATLQ